MALFQTLTDEFTSGTIDSSKWLTPFGTVAATGGQLVLSVAAASTTYSGMDSKLNYDLTGSYAYVQVVNAGDQTLSGLENQPIQLVKDGSNILSWYIINGTIKALTRVAGVTTTHNSTTYNSTTHQWLRIRESGGTVFWDYSSDGSSWNNLYSVANPFAITSLAQEFSFGNFTGQAATTTTLDNFNTLPTLLPSVSESLVITESKSVLFPGVTLSVNVSDSLSLSESQSLVLIGVILSISKSDTLVITESKSVAISADKNINKADTAIVLSESAVVSPPYPIYDEKALRRINYELDVSWKNQSNLSSRTFTIGSSTIGSTDIIGIDIGAIGSPSNYLYYDESDYVIGLAWEEALVQPIGGLNTSLAEAVLDNTSQRFTPEFMGGDSELFTATFEPRKPIIIGADIDPNSPQVQFTGITKKAANIDFKAGTISLSAVDYVDYFSSKFVDSSPMYTGQRSDQILESLLLRAGMSTAQYELETGQNTIGFAMFDTGVTYADAISAIVEAEDGQFYQDENGKFHFENRLHYSNSPFNQSVATIPESIVLDSKAPNQDHIVNVVEINYNPRVKTSSTTIFTLSGTITLPTGQSDVFLNFDNPVLAANAPVFAANSQSDGSGSNVTASVNVHNTALFAQAVKYTFNNTSGSTAYITSMTIQGRWAVLRYDNPQYYRAQDSSSLTAYQEQKVSINNDYIQDSSWASSFSQLILADYSDPAKLLDITIRAKPSLRRGDLITYKSTSWRIYRIRSTLDAQTGYVQELSLVSRGLASGSGVVYFKIGSSTIGSSDEIAP